MSPSPSIGSHTSCVLENIKLSLQELGKQVLIHLLYAIFNKNQHIFLIKFVFFYTLMYFFFSFDVFLYICVFKLNNFLQEGIIDTFNPLTINSKSPSFEFYILLFLNL